MRNIRNNAHELVKPFRTFFGKYVNNEHPLLLLARRIERLEAMGMAHAICEKVDVTNSVAYENAVRKAEAVYGLTDLIINNAGVMLLGGLENQEPKEWQQMLDVNVMGVMNGMQIVMQNMKEAQTGTIINISSIAGVKPFANHAVHCASKYGVIGLSEVAITIRFAYAMPKRCKS